MKVVALADSDSYVKWAAALLSTVPAHWRRELVVVRTVKLPSNAQLDSALAGSGISAEDVVILDFADAVAFVAAQHPDVVLIATIGPLADIVAEDVLAACSLAACSQRPVLVSGLPGIALPARRKALIYRSQVDLIVLHSKREIRRFAGVAEANRLDHAFGLATMPFLRENRARLHETGDIIFAAQAIVPATARERILLLSWLVTLATRHPQRRVVIKVRAIGTEAQTHEERDSYVDLLERKFDQAPRNLVVAGGPMGDHLATASGLVTVSSTAALEAVAIGVPVIVLDEFGVSPELINEVFVGSGLLASADDLIECRFRDATPRWRDDNYFHGDDDNTWIDELVSLVELGRVGLLEPRRRVVRGAGGTLRRAWDRRQALGPYDRATMGFIAQLVGTPARGLLLGFRSVQRALKRLALTDEATPFPRRGESSRRASRDRVDQL